MQCRVSLNAQVYLYVSHGSQVCTLKYVSIMSYVYRVPIIGHFFLTCYGYRLYLFTVEEEVNASTYNKSRF